MHKCPKCLSQYGDDLKICRTCGAILEFVTQEQLQVPENEPSPQERKTQVTLTEQSSWTCSLCGQFVPGSFDVCWNCGTGQDGMPDLSFRKESEIENCYSGVRETSEQTTVNWKEYRCLRCGSSKIVPRVRILDQGQYSNGKLQVVIDADPDALIFKDRLYDQITADICGECGRVELKAEHPQELYEHFLRSQDGGRK